jgi:hypothetical protein
MRSGILAFEGVKKAVAFHGVFAGHGRGSGGFARAGDSEDVRNVQAKCGGVPVRRKIGEGEPSRREKQISAIFVDKGSTHTGYGAVLLINE